ncbi:MAG: M15 family metallopeptidase [Xylanivirga thermophila]|jgi:zinc D-Ala-D-Ala carboxypeptidase
MTKNQEGYFDMKRKKIRRRYIIKRRFKIFCLLLILAISFPFLHNHFSPKQQNHIVTSPDSILVLVNRNNNLPNGYVPKDLVTPNIQFTFKEDLPKKQMRKEAAEAIEALFAEAEKNGMKLYGVSGYRPYERQKQIFDQKALATGEAEAMKYVALPGQSEHQTGLAMDITSEKGAKNLLKEGFGKTPEYQWLKENAHKYGFIIRYPQGKEDITGYNYEPWHIRYVGVKSATKIFKKDITLEEFISGAK